MKKNDISRKMEELEIFENNIFNLSTQSSIEFHPSYIMNSKMKGNFTKFKKEILNYIIDERLIEMKKEKQKAEEFLKYCRECLLS